MAGRLVRPRGAPDTSRAGVDGEILCAPRAITDSLDIHLTPPGNRRGFFLSFFADSVRIILLAWKTLNQATNANEGRWNYMN
jgi:hypothetical protein